MQMITLTEEQRQKANAKAVRERLFGKPQKPKALLISVERPKRPDMDQSYHMVLYRKYLLRLEKAQQTLGNKVIYANFSISPSAEYIQPAQILDFSYSEILPIRRTMLEITLEVLKDYPGISLDDIRSKRRFDTIMKPRHLAWYKVFIERPDLSYPVISKFFCRNHTALIHGVMMMKYKLEGDEKGEAWANRKKSYGARYHQSRPELTARKR